MQCNILYAISIAMALCSCVISVVHADCDSAMIVREDTINEFKKVHGESRDLKQIRAILRGKTFCDMRCKLSDSVMHRLGKVYELFRYEMGTRHGEYYSFGVYRNEQDYYLITGSNSPMQSAFAVSRIARDDALDALNTMRERYRLDSLSSFIIPLR